MATPSPEEQQNSSPDNILIPLEIIDSILEFLSFRDQSAVRLCSRTFDNAFYRADKTAIKTALKYDYQEDEVDNSNNKDLFAQWLKNKQEQNHVLSLMPFFGLDPTGKHHAKAIDKQSFTNFKTHINTLDQLFGKKLKQVIFALHSPDDAAALVKDYQKFLKKIKKDLDLIIDKLPESYPTTSSQPSKPYGVTLSFLAHFVPKISFLQKSSSAPQPPINETRHRELLWHLFKLKTVLQTVIENFAEHEKAAPLYLKNFYGVLVTFYRQIEALQPDKGTSHLDQMLQEKQPTL